MFDFTFSCFNIWQNYLFDTKLVKKKLLSTGDQGTETKEQETENTLLFFLSSFKLLRNLL